MKNIKKIKISFKYKFFFRNLLEGLRKKKIKVKKFLEIKYLYHKFIKKKKNKKQLIIKLKDFIILHI